MELTYSCMGLSDMGNRCWEGQLRLLKLDNPCEVELSARGSTFHLLVGRHSYGNYLCIPSKGIGIGLAKLEDSFWNLEHLSNTYPYLSVVDAISIVDGLAALDCYITF